MQILKLIQESRDRWEVTQQHMLPVVYNCSIIFGLVKWQSIEMQKALLPFIPVHQPKAQLMILGYSSCLGIIHSFLLLRLFLCHLDSFPISTLTAIKLVGVWQIPLQSDIPEIFSNESMEILLQIVLSGFISSCVFQGSSNKPEWSVEVWSV